MTRRYAILANADLAIYDLAECIIANARFEVLMAGNALWPDVIH
jgi:hypothetical protein